MFLIDSLSWGEFIRVKLTTLLLLLILVVVYIQAAYVSLICCAILLSPLCMLHRLPLESRNLIQDSHVFTHKSS